MGGEEFHRRLRVEADGGEIRLREGGNAPFGMDGALGEGFPYNRRVLVHPEDGVAGAAPDGLAEGAADQPEADDLYDHDETFFLDLKLLSIKV